MDFLIALHLRVKKSLEKPGLNRKAQRGLNRVQVINIH